MWSLGDDCVCECLEIEGLGAGGAGVSVAQ